MRNASTEFANGIIYGHNVAVKCEIWDPVTDSVVAEPTVTAGSVTLDISQSVRRQCSLTLEDPSGVLVPDEAHSILQPYSGYYLRLYRGMYLRDGSAELIPLGVFAPYKPHITDSGDSLEISVSGYDRSKLISRTRWIEPYNVPKGTNTALAVKTLVESRMPGMKYNLEPTNSTTPNTTFGTETDNDPWKDISDLASSDGMEVFFDAEDIVTMRTIPDPDSSPVVNEYADDENCTVMQFERENDGSKMYTQVIVTSESSDEDVPPIRVVVQREDTDMHIPYFLNSPLMTTEDQARKAGESLLKRVGRSEYTVTLTAVPDPRMEVGDVVRIVRGLSKLNDTFVISRITMPLDAESTMSIETEARRMG